MKKLFAVLTALCLLCCSVAVFAEAAPAAPVESPKPIYITPDVTFGMSQEDVIKAHGNARYERDVENDVPGLFIETLEFEHYRVMDNDFAEIHYYFINNRLIGAKANFDDNRTVFAKLESKLTAEHGNPTKVDPSMLGNAIFALDDDGRLSPNTVAWISGTTVIVLEQEHDDVNLSCLDLAEFTK